MSLTISKDEFPKELVDWTYEQVRAYCVGRDLDALVKGESIKDRVANTIQFTAAWAYERGERDAEKKSR